MLAALLLLPACGEVIANEDAGLCAQAACDDSDGGAPGGAGSGARNKPKGPGAADAGQQPAPTEITELPCQLCARADNCCKAAGRGDCNYTAACTSAKPGKRPWHEARCRAVLAGTAGGSEPPAGVCGS